MILLLSASSHDRRCYGKNTFVNIFSFKYCIGPYLLMNIKPSREQNLARSESSVHGTLRFLPTSIDLNLSPNTKNEH